MTVRIALAKLGSLVGECIGPSESVEVTQARVDAFAQSTLDQQWIHVDPMSAAAGPFGGTIAHGFLTLSLLSNFMAELLEISDAEMAINYGLDRVRFTSVVPVGSLVRASVVVCTVVAKPEYTTMRARSTFEVAPFGGASPAWQSKPCCVADSVTRFVAKQSGANP